MADNGKANAEVKAKAPGKAKQPGAAPPAGAPVLGQQQQEQQQPAVQQQVDPAQALAAFQAVIAQQQQQLAQQGALMQQLLDRQLEMEEAGFAGGHGGGGYGGGNTERARQSKVEPPPSFSGTPSGWEEWKRRLQEWEVRFFDLDVREKPSLLMACLSGEALGLARSAVPTGEELGNPASFRKILNALEAQYSLRKGLRRFRAFRKIVAFRNTGKNFDAYLRQWHLLLAAAQREGMKWEHTEPYLLLINANLGETQMEHVMAQLEPAQRAAEIAAAANGQPPPEDVITVQQVESMLRTLAQARQMRSLGSDTRYQRVPALAGLAQDDSGATVSEPAWEGGEEDAEWDEEDDGEDDDDPVAFAALQTLETLVGDEGNEYSIAPAALKRTFSEGQERR